MKHLTAVQLDVLSRLTDQPKSAYSLRASLATLRALVKAGRARDVTPRGPGAMFSPRTHYQFVKA